MPVPSSFVKEGGDIVATLILAGLELPGDRSGIAAAHIAEADAIRGIPGP